MAGSKKCKTTQVSRESINEEPPEAPAQKGIENMSDMPLTKKRKSHSCGSSHHSNIQGANQSDELGKGVETTTATDDDFNICSPECTELLTHLKSLLKDKPVTPTFWAGCQLGDMKALEKLVAHAKIDPHNITSSAEYTSENIPLMCKPPDFQGLLKLCGHKYANVHRDPKIPKFFRDSIKDIHNE